MNPLDFIFPKRCVSCAKLGNYICSSCKEKVQIVEYPICPICQRQAIGGRTHPSCAGTYKLDGLIIAAKYRGPTKAAISKLKYKWVYDIGEVLTDLIVDNFWRFDLKQDAILIPIPLHPKRKNWRGFNQAELIAKQIAKRFNVPSTSLLQRTIETKTQVGLSKQERRKNIRNAFRPVGKSPKQKTLILVDDVYTTGATMQEACSTLKHDGAKEVWGMAVALG